MARKKTKHRKLANGLEVVFLEMHELPVVCTLLCYNVGSRDEGRGESGLSHFLEHMMFKGTSRLRRGEIDAITARLGGINNAMTSEDSTCYLFRVAADRWEKVLEIEADRMQGCLLDVEEFNQEKKVVLEELRMGKDEPWHMLYHAVEATAYHVHPYHHPIIGWEEEITNVTQEEMARFYRRHYRPNRATLVVVGDVDPVRGFAAVEKHFGKLQSSDFVRPAAPVEPPQQGERRVQVRAPGAITRLAMAWRGVSLAAPEEPLLDIIAGILGGGRTSRLYLRLVQGEELASSVAVYNESRLDPGLFWVLVDLKEGMDPARVEEVIKEEVALLGQRQPPKKELDRVRARIETGLHFGSEETYGTAMRIGEYAMGADLAVMDRYPKILAETTPGQVKAVARDIFQPDSLTVGLSLPTKGGAGGGSGRAKSVAKAEPVRFCYRRGSRRFPPIKRVELPNGLKILAVRKRLAPVVSVLCSVDAGQEFETRAKSGVGGIVGSCLAEGTTKRSGEALALAVESLGGYLGTSAEGVGVRMAARDLDKAISFLDEVVRRPAFPAKAVKRIKSIAAAEILADLEHPKSVASLKFREMIFGKHPLAMPGRGYPESLAKLRPADLRAWHQRLFVPSQAVVAVVGDVDPREAIDRVAAKMGGWRGTVPTLPRLPELVRVPGRRDYFLPMDREQVHILLGHLGVTRDHPDYYTLLVMDHILGTGPGFTDRISRKLRDQMGLAYTVSASITSTARKLPGYFAAYIGTSPENREAALAGFLSEIELMRLEPPTPEEVQSVHDYLTGSFYLGLEKSASVARFLVGMERFGLGLDFLDRYPDLIRAQGPEDILAAARRHLFPDDLALVCAGPEEGK